MSEPSTLIRKQIIEYCDDNPGWSHSRIARVLESERPDLVDDLFNAQRSYMLNQWVNREVARHRAGIRSKVRSGELIAMMSPDREGKLYKLGEMTGTQALVVGRGYVSQGARLTSIGKFYIKVGEEAGRRKVRNVFNNDALRALYDDYAGGH